MPQENMTDKKVFRYRVLEIYHTLNSKSKRAVKQKFMLHFGVTFQTFYAALRSDSLLADHLQFFALCFSMSMDDLVNEPLDVDVLENDREVLKRKLAKKLNLELPKG